MSSRGSASWPSSRAATWRPDRPLLSWDREGRTPSRVRHFDRDVLVRQYVPDPLDEARAARRDLLAVPSVLHGQAEARRHGRPGGALPAPARARRARPARPQVRPVATVGGQAVLEGVMMRSPGNWAVAVRTPGGSIEQVTRPIDSAMGRHWLLRLPIVRGVMALGESLAIGFRALAISANYAAREEGDDGEVETELSRGMLIFAFAIAIGFAVALFKVTPGLITEALPIK